MTVSRLLAIALQAELWQRHSIALPVSECEAMVAVLERMGKVAEGAKRAEGQGAEVVQISERRP